MRIGLRITIVALLALSATHGTGLADETGIHVDQAWARATPGGTKTGAVYLTLSNNGNAADKLIAASTPTAEKAQLHVTTVENGVMKMRPVPALDIAPGKPIVMDPMSGYHIMLTGLKAPLKEGDHVPLTLTFEHAGTQQVTASVAKVGAMHAGEKSSSMPGMSAPGDDSHMSMPGMQH